MYVHAIGLRASNSSFTSEMYGLRLGLGLGLGLGTREPRSICNVHSRPQNLQSILSATETETLTTSRHLKKAE